MSLGLQSLAGEPVTDISFPKGGSIQGGVVVTYDDKSTETLDASKAVFNKEKTQATFTLPTGSTVVAALTNEGGGLTLSADEDHLKITGEPYVEAGHGYSLAFSSDGKELLNLPGTIGAKVIAHIEVKPTAGSFEESYPAGTTFEVRAQATYSDSTIDLIPQTDPNLTFFSSNAKVLQANFDTDADDDNGGKGIYKAVAQGAAQIWAGYAANDDTHQQEIDSAKVDIEVGTAAFYTIDLKGIESKQLTAGTMGPALTGVLVLTDGTRNGTPNLNNFTLTSSNTKVLDVVDATATGNPSLNGVKITGGKSVKLKGIAAGSNVNLTAEYDDGAGHTAQVVFSGFSVTAPPTLKALTVTATPLADGKSTVTVTGNDAANMLRYKVTAADAKPTVAYNTVCDKAGGWEDYPADKGIAGTAGQVVTVVDLVKSGAYARAVGTVTLAAATTA